MSATDFDSAVQSRDVTAAMSLKFLSLLQSLNLAENYGPLACDGPQKRIGFAGSPDRIGRPIDSWKKKAGIRLFSTS